MNRATQILTAVLIALLVSSPVLARKMDRPGVKSANPCAVLKLPKCAYSGWFRPTQAEPVR